MRNRIVYLAIGLVAGAAASAWYLGAPENRSTRATLPDSQAESLEARLIEVEAVLAEQLGSVRDDIATLRSDLESLSEASTEPAQPPLRSLPGAASPGAVAASNAELERIQVRAASQKGRVELLTEAGFSPARAEEIERMVEEHRVAAMQARYDAARRGDAPPLGNAETEALFDTDSMLRAELGDADFERYLSAMGRPTEVTVMSVLSSSAAQQAGMQVGDRIVAYDGRRVFHVRELVELPVVGEPGAPVIVDILRDGQAMQLVLPRGPLGIVGNVGPLTRITRGEEE